MRGGTLELASFAVRDIRLGDSTGFHDGVLTVRPEEIAALATEDPLIEDATVSVARPGESCRIVHVIDIVEPRHKVAGPGRVFPGFLGPPVGVGEGRTHVLDGAAVVAAGDPVPGEATHWREGIIDMAGPGAAFTPFSRTVNLVLHLRGKAGDAPDSHVMLDRMRGSVLGHRFNRAVRSALTRIADRLAATTAQGTPDRVDVCDLPPPPPALPRVALVYQAFWPYLYGAYYEDTTPTVLQPSEFFDGAVVNGFPGSAARRHVTYLLQRHALCAELVKRHGRDLAFLGVIFFHSQATSQDDKERSSSRVIKLLQSLGAQAVLITGLGGGNLVVDLMMICERAERAGIPSTLLMTEMVAASDDTGVFVDFVREADAIVNVGNYQEMIQLPGVSRVLGGSALIGSGEPAGGELRVPMACLVEATSMVGAGRTVARAY